MAELEQGLEELKEVKQAFKDNISANNISTSNVQFRNMPGLLKQMEKKLPTQTKSVEPTKYPQIIKADEGYKLEAVAVREIPSQYIIPSGTKEITENNEYDVTDYSRVKVAVKGVGTGNNGNPKFSQLIDGTIQTIDATDLSEPSTIKDYTFYYCANLTSVVIPSNIKRIGSSAFEGCSSLQTLHIADGVTTIGASAFKGISASVITIPSTLSVLETEVFADNLALTSITIPENITEIKDNAFSGCTNLTEITMDGLTPPVVTNISLPASVTTIYVKYGAYESYLAQWSDYSSKIVRLPAIPSSITVIVNNYLNELVNGANVTVSGNEQTFTGTTNENGVFVVNDLQPATYTVSVGDIDGFITPETKEIVITENSHESIIFTYEERPAIPPFALATPAEISAISAEISANNMTSAEVEAAYGWKIGDTIDITLNTGEVIQMRIIGFNHDNLYYESGKAGITLQMVNLLQNPIRMASSSTSNKNGWFQSEMRMPNLLVYGLQALPTEWQSVIKYVSKKSAQSGTSTTINTTADQVFLLSGVEIFGSQEDYGKAQNGANEGTQYEYWAIHNTPSDRIKYFIENGSRRAWFWWQRSCFAGSSVNFATVNNNGNTGAAAPNNTNTRVSFAFCV